MDQAQTQPQAQPQQPVSGNRRTGKCKFFDCQKGFGFIIPDEPVDGNNVEIFVHHTSICNNGGFRSLAEGESVEFDLIQGSKGLQASNVTGPNGGPVKGDPRGGQRPNNYMQQNQMFQNNRRNNYYNQRPVFNNGYQQGYNNQNYQQQNPWGGYGYQNQFQKMNQMGGYNQGNGYPMQQQGYQMAGYNMGNMGNMQAMQTMGTMGNGNMASAMNSNMGNVEQ
ncbi:CSD-domain-containing protein [Neocallimastix lanati (nom. inval.)]|jgi:cold shock CspA family protein|uniref:CSD-domain-containing protein n=1 Tax=Neocallimastix californiae TaxID=1754190 RepID=A0A1Y2D9D3_9FUNG|nr:CSD-domain-containing protein [Neocallimastix sp. JGI-2020a]ORY55784.1 CSD-domain-containing protein [Neocallimastix californiae]|eukprot:ORY55784.1 CSD-domain-containing protein [Neocallimastix californiae]